MDGQRDECTNIYALTYVYIYFNLHGHNNNSNGVPNKFNLFTMFTNHLAACSINGYLIFYVFLHVILSTLNPVSLSKSSHELNYSTLYMEWQGIYQEKLKYTGIATQQI